MEEVKREEKVEVAKHKGAGSAEGRTTKDNAHKERCQKAFGPHSPRTTVKPEGKEAAKHGRRMDRGTRKGNQRAKESSNLRPPKSKGNGRHQVWISSRPNNNGNNGRRMIGSGRR